MIDRMNGRIHFACFGDSIVSDQVTGTGTRIGELLNAETVSNYACGYATLSDWHEGGKNITPVSLEEPWDLNEPVNVLSNQIRRCLDRVQKGGPAPDVIYLAAGINDGNDPRNALFDDTDRVLSQSFEELDRCSPASALRWAVMELKRNFPDAAIFAAAPLFTFCDQPWMDRETVLMKREICRKVAEKEGIFFLDSTMESGFTPEVAKENGGIHPNGLWKENIARYAAGKIRNTLGNLS